LPEQRERTTASFAVISNYCHERHGERSRSWQLDLHCKVSLSLSFPLSHSLSLSLSSLSLARSLARARPTCAISLNCVAAASSSERVKLVTKAPSLLPTLVYCRLPRSDKGSSCIPLPGEPLVPDSRGRIARRRVRRCYCAGVERRVGYIYVHAERTSGYFISTDSLLVLRGISDKFLSSRIADRRALSRDAFVLDSGAYMRVLLSLILLSLIKFEIKAPEARIGAESTLRGFFVARNSCATIRSRD